MSITPSGRKSTCIDDEAVRLITGRSISRQNRLFELRSQTRCPPVDYGIPKPRRRNSDRCCESSQQRTSQSITTSGASQVLLDEIPCCLVVEFVAPFKNQVLESIGQPQPRIKTCRNRSQRLAAIAMINAIVQSRLDLECSRTDDRRNIRIAK